MSQTSAVRSALLAFIVSSVLLAFVPSAWTRALLFFVITPVLLIGLVLVAYGAVAKNRWGINLKPVNCPVCNFPMPQIREPKSLQQKLWGGWTCEKCGCEVDKWGRQLAAAP